MMTLVGKQLIDFTKYGEHVKGIKLHFTDDTVSNAELFDWCAINRQEWMRVLCDNGTYVIREYLKSITWELKNEEDE